MFPIVSIVGRSNSGKTTLLEKLVVELKARGYRLATVKHSSHSPAVDQAGKDSWRLAQAGSDTVALVSPGDCIIFKKTDHDWTPEQVYAAVGSDVDLVLAEGFKQSSLRKIEVHRSALGGLLCPVDELMAIVTEDKLDVAVPQFAPSDVRPIADFIEKAASPQREGAVVCVNGSPLTLNPFVQEMMTRTLLAMVSTLKGAEDIRTLQVWMRKKQG